MARFDRKTILPLIIVAVIASILTSVLFLTFYSFEKSLPPVYAQKEETVTEPKIMPAAFGVSGSSWEESIIKVNKAAAPAVVYIDTVRTVKGRVMGVPDLFREFLGDEFFKDFENRQYEQKGTGSGFIIRYKSDEYIITNNHVIEGADKDKITVTLKNGKEYKAGIVGTDKKYDLAVLKIKAENLPYLEMGDSDNLEIGQWVVAIGNPFGLHETVTTGIISALNRSLEGLNESALIQTDAAINPGNSGGPLMDLEGRVVGINEAILSNAQGIGFAIPINLLKDNLDQLISKGQIARPPVPWLGIYMETVNEDITEYYELPFKTGVYVGRVIKGSPAEKAGLQPGDIITQINREELKTREELAEKIQKMKIGQKISLLVYRDKSFKKIDVVLEERPETFSLDSRE